MLVVLSMFLTLQDEDGAYESSLTTMREVLPPEMFDLMAPAGTEWDAPVVGLPFEVPPVPGPEVYNLRRKRTGKPEIELPLTVGRGAAHGPDTVGGPGRRRRAWQQQLGRERQADAQRRGACRERHAPGDPRAQYVVPGPPRVDRRDQRTRWSAPRCQACPRS